MNTRLAIDEQSQLTEMREPAPEQPAIIKIFAKLISYIFHPLFVPVYIVGFLVYIQPYLYSGFSAWDKKIVVIQAFVMYTFFPLITVLLLKGLKFIDSIFLHTQRDRIIPFTACMIWYFWAWYVRHNLPGTPHELVYFSLAVFIVSILGMLANIYMKVSMHAMAMGVATTFLMLMSFSQDISFTVYVSLALIITGIVCTSRLIVSDHTAGEIYVGLFIGVISQIAAYYIA